VILSDRALMTPNRQLKEALPRSRNRLASRGADLRYRPFALHSSHHWRVELHEVQLPDPSEPILASDRAESRLLTSTRVRRCGWVQSRFIDE
jgi:hypothetical protein